jgi:adenylosuccinate lyase
MQTNSALTVLNAVSPLDGRYASRCDALRPLLSEAGFMAHRVEVEIAWLIGLSQAGLSELSPFSEAATQVLRNLVAVFSEAD